MLNRAIKIALCQLNLTTGDFSGNFKKAEAALSEGDADIFVFPECQVTNYPADDLYLHSAFVADAEKALEGYAALSRTTGKTIAVGASLGSAGRKPYNAVMVFSKGQLVHTASKTHLPNYDVFDDERWFTPQAGFPGTLALETASGEVSVGFCVCEDIWFDDVTTKLADAGAEILISLNSSPYSIAKAKFRRGIFADRVKSAGIPLVYVNQVGGNDELVWDGMSAVLDVDGNFFETMPWQETVDFVELNADAGSGFSLATVKDSYAQPFDVERYIAACLGLRDYVHKNGFSKVVLGLSGGADSALVGLMAADVFGEQKVDFILMPSVYTSSDSNNLAKELADGIGVGCKAITIPMQSMFDSFTTAFGDAVGSTERNVAEENLQAQIRGDILSWYSNKFGNMILSTGNKSEIAMGYATLYGDMRGGFNPLKDLYKTEVFELLELRHRHAIASDRAFDEMFTAAFGHGPAALSEAAASALRSITDRPPSAELADGQLDSDSLPDYPVLDKILWAMIDHKDSLSNEEVAADTGQPLPLVEEIRRRMRVMEYKRFQSCPGPKIHRKSFTKKDWRHPMASAYRK